MAIQAPASIFIDTAAVELEWADESTQRCRVIPYTGLAYPSEVSFTRQNNVVCICWSNNSQAGGDVMAAPLSCLLHTEPAELPEEGPSVRLSFEEGFTLNLTFESQSALDHFLQSLKNNLSEDKGVKDSADPVVALQLKLTVTRERAVARMREAEARARLIALDSRMWRQRIELMSNAFVHWRGVAAEAVSEQLSRDKNRWCLHAKASEDLDLQAWYHDSFHEEIFSLKVKFWLHDSALPSYKLSNKLIANKLTKYEEAALAHVLCTPDTTYGDVAGHMFVVQSMLRPELFALFEQICSKGISLVKFPRSGSPAKKLFRFSFVEGAIYLTWKGQYGNQGVELAEVTSVVEGISTDIFRRAGRKDKEQLYLSLLCSERSVDLQCANREERDNLREVLAVVVAKERGSFGLPARPNSTTSQEKSE